MLHVVFPGSGSLCLSCLLFFTRGSSPWLAEVLFALQGRCPRLCRLLLRILFFLQLNWPRPWCLLLLLFLLNVSCFGFGSFLLPLARSQLGFRDILLLRLFLQSGPELGHLLLPLFWGNRRPCQLLLLNWRLPGPEGFLFLLLTSWFSKLIPTFGEIWFSSIICFPRLLFVLFAWIIYFCYVASIKKLDQREKTCWVTNCIEDLEGTVNSLSIPMSIDLNHSANRKFLLLFYLKKLSYFFIHSFPLSINRNTNFDIWKVTIYIWLAESE